MTAGGIWGELLSSALVGVERRPCVISGSDGPLATVVPAGPVNEATLLRAAGVLTVARRAGYTARKMPIPQAVEFPAEPPAPAAAAARLSALLGGVRTNTDQGGSRRLLTEWLELAQSRGVVAPAHLVPFLLDIGAQDDANRGLLRSAGGARAQWLAGLRPRDWGWCAPEPELTGDDWEDGANRVAYLAHLRERDPAAGRDLLLQAWPNESAADLAALIAACHKGLSLDDEEWLERALDGRQAVRSAAVSLLQSLPGSAFGARMADRLLACFAVKGRKTLRVEPPAACDAGMKRDGIEQKPKYGRGEKAWWLQRIVESAPLDAWLAIDPDPGSLLSREVEDHHGLMVHQALTYAVLKQRDPVWALHLCRLPHVVGHAARTVAQLLPVDEAVEVAVAAVNACSPHATEFLSALPRPWPQPACAAVLARLGSRSLTKDETWRSLVIHAQSGLPPEAAADVEKPAGDVPFGEVLRQLATFLHVRSEMHREFAR